MAGLAGRGSVSNFYGLIFVLSVIGCILFLVTEFAGYTSPPYFYWYSVSFESTFYNPDHAAYAPVFILVAGLFLFNMFLSLKELRIIRTNFPPGAVKLGIYASLSILLISVVGGIGFEAIMSQSSARDWWLGTGFYVGLIGGILLTALYYFIMKKPEEAVQT